MRRFAAILREGDALHQEWLTERDNQIDLDLAAFRARHGERRQQAKIAASWDRALAAFAAETDKAPDDEFDEEPQKPRYAPHPEKLKPGKRKRRTRFGSSAIEQGWDVALADFATQEP